MDPILVTDKAVFVEDLLAEMEKHPCCGAGVWFLGIVREEFQKEAPEKKVRGIFYECHPPMAEKELGKIIGETKEKWPVHQIGVAHRIGYVAAGETSLIVVVFSPHRQEAFAAISFVVDELKKRVPIWKKEIYEESSHPGGR